MARAIGPGVGAGPAAAAGAGLAVTGAIGAGLGTGAALCRLLTWDAGCVGPAVSGVPMGLTWPEWLVVLVRIMGLE